MNFPQRLIDGYGAFASGRLTAEQDRFRELAEKGQAPDRIVATGRAMPGISRPLCPYPKVARYRGGDPSSAESFDCAG